MRHLKVLRFFFSLVRRFLETMADWWRHDKVNFFATIVAILWLLLFTIWYLYYLMSLPPEEYPIVVEGGP